MPENNGNVVKRKKKKKHPIRSFFSLLVIFVSCFLIYMAGEDFVTTLKLKKEISNSESMINNLENQQNDLKEKKKKLEDPNYVVRYSRGKYMLSKPGEQIFKLPSKNENDND